MEFFGLDNQSGLLIIVSIYAVLTLGLNVQWGFTGLFNIGVAGFFALGGYMATILTSRQPRPDQFEEFLFGGNLPAHFDKIPVVDSLDLWFLVSVLGAGAAAGLVAVIVGAITLRLRDDYLAIATLGIAESIRLVFLNEGAIGNGAVGLFTAPRVLDGLVDPEDYDLLYLGVVAAVLLVLFLLVRLIVDSPWGRVLRAIREDETTAAASGKDVMRFKLQAFVLGAVIMGIGGALYAHNFKGVAPTFFEPLLGTFIVWAMLMVGGSGSNIGAIIGAIIVWELWAGSQSFPEPLSSPNTRLFMVGLIIVLVLLLAPRGIVEESKRLRKLFDRLRPAARSKT